MNCGSAGTGSRKDSSPQTRIFSRVRLGSEYRNRPRRPGLPIIMWADSPSWGRQAASPPPRGQQQPSPRQFLLEGSRHDLKFGFDFHRTTIQQYFDKYFRGGSSSKATSETWSEYVNRPRPLRISSRVTWTAVSNISEIRSATPLKTTMAFTCRTVIRARRG